MVIPLLMGATILTVSTAFVAGKIRKLEHSLMTTGDEKPPEENRFNKAILAGDLDEPMMMDIAPDGSIYIIERKGALKRYYPQTKTIKTIATFNVFSLLEDGLLGFALDPEYAQNNFAYFYYSPPGTKPVQNVSRFILKGDSLIKESEKIILEVAVQRETCCHSAGSLRFGPGGNLWISVGDNTSSKESSGYSPLDERPGRAPFDAQKSSANSQDLRGKILRIKPTAEGGYTIPAGNMFTDAKEGRPEIYVMGCRNPFRFSVDKNGVLYWGDVGPDSGSDDPKGPRSYDEFNQAKGPGYYGWPYFVADNKAYSDFDFATNTIGEKFNPEAPVNNSPNNTGLKNLPPAKKPFIWYAYDESKEFPHLGKGSRSAEAGPLYYFDDHKSSKNKFPQYYDKKLFICEWARGWINVVSFDEAGNYKSIEPFLPNTYFSKPIDMMFGKDGAMYILEYGQNYFAKNEEARLARIDYAENNRMPVAKAAANVTEGAVPLNVKFSGKESVDYDKNDKLKYQWYFTGAGKVESTEVEPVFSFTKPGTYKVILKVSDNQGESATSEIIIKAGNSKPVVNLKIKDNSTFYWDNYLFPYQVKVTDKEDGTLEKGIDPSKVTLNIDFLPQGRDLALIMGHQYNTAVSKYEKGKMLIEGSDCRSCHSYSQMSVGPSYVMVAKKYKGDESAVTALAQKIIKGGNGNWGDRLMSAHPQHTPEETAEMVKYILSLAEVKEQYPLQGTFTAKEHIGQGEEGVYVFSLSYNDKGANGIGSLGASQIKYLRYPKVEADLYELSKNVGLNRPNAGALAFASFQSNGSYIGFKGIDLTNIQKLKLRILSPLEGTKLEVRIDAPPGKQIGQLTVKKIGDNKWNEQEVIISEASGLHDLYFVATNPGKQEKELLNLDWIYFDRVASKKL